MERDYIGNLGDRNNEQTIKFISTKANTLKALNEVIKLGYIEEMLIITAKEYHRDKKKTADKIIEKFKGEKIVVRSSSTNEDCFVKSNAGHYTSILDVDSANETAIINAIDTVLKSYTLDIDDIEDEQVLIQHQAVDVLYSGVLFTYDIQGQRPYYLINYDDSGSTDSVTSGKGGKTLWIARNTELSELNTAWKNLLESVQEIEDLLKIPLDIEFAVNKKNEVIIFQVRPLVANTKNKNAINAINDFYSKLNDVKKDYDRIECSLDGQPMILSDMAFWNPSEIIGTSPRNLDYSLYREIITSRAWNQGLVPMGYKKLEKELMYKIGVKPYISIQYSFYSLIPAEISEKLALKLVDFYVNKLKQDTTAHDKIEFEIVYTSYDFNTENRTKELLENGFTRAERNTIVEALHKLTLNTIEKHGLISIKDNADINHLENERKRIASLDSETNNIHRILEDITELLDAIKSLGTPQFTRQARMAFMAKSFCSSLVEAGWFTNDEIDEFMKSINTVSSKFDYDFHKFSLGLMSRNEFNKIYGHLRSGTYDIRTDSYNQMVFRPVTEKNKNYKDKNVSKGLDENRLKEALTSIGFDIHPKEFNNFLVSAIEGREFFKFEFTNSEFR